MTSRIIQTGLALLAGWAILDILRTGKAMANDIIGELKAIRKALELRSDLLSPPPR